MLQPPTLGRARHSSIEPSRARNLKRRRYLRVRFDACDATEPPETRVENGRREARVALAIGALLLYHSFFRAA
jgi:hypothetical protein